MRDQIRVAGEVAHDPTLLRIVLAFFGFNMAELATWVAILVYAYGRGGASAAGVVAAIQLVPSAIVAPFGAFAGDRFPRHRVLFISYLVQAAAQAMVAVALFSGAPFALTLLFATTAAVSFTFTRPTQAALLPSVSDGPEELTAANAVSTLTGSAGVVVGPFIAGILLTLWGPAQVFAVFAGIALLAALLVARLEIVGDEPKEPLEIHDLVRQSLGGFGFLFRDRPAGVLVLVMAGGIVVVGALDVLFVALAIGLLDKGQGWAGFLNSAAGLGGVIGAALAVGLVGRRRLVPPLAGGTFVFGGSVAAIGIAPAVATAPVLLALSGAGGSVSQVAGQTLLQRIAPDEVLARVFGVLEGAGMFAAAVGSLGASALIAAFGTRIALVALGCFAPLVVFAMWIPLASIDRDAKAPDAQVLAFVRRMPIFAPLPAPAIERIVAHLTRLEVPAGEVLMRQGEIGDRLLMIVEGKAEVTRDGQHVIDCFPGSHVGEIALLRDVPRTATVTSTTPMVLLTLDREPFLEAVTGHPQTHAHAQSIVQDRLPPERRDP